MKYEDIKAGKIYNNSDFGPSWKIIYVDDAGYLFEFVDEKRNRKWNSSHEVTTWFEIKPKAKKKVFFIIYHAYPDRIYTHNDDSQYYSTPVTIEQKHRDCLKSSSIKWVSPIHEIEFEDPR